MAHHIPEHKIIIVQTVIFIGLLVLLSFILEGCTHKPETAGTYVESGYIIASMDQGSEADNCNEDLAAVPPGDCTNFSQPVVLAATREVKANITIEDPI